MEAELTLVQTELAQLQQELAEEAPLIPDSQLPVLTDLSPPTPSQVATSMPQTNGPDHGAATAEVANKRAKRVHATATPAATANSEVTQSQPVPVGRKTAKKKRKV